MLKTDKLLFLSLLLFEIAVADIGEDNGSDRPGRHYGAVAFLFIFIILIITCFSVCIFYLTFHLCKNKYVVYKERKSRPIDTSSMGEGEFDVQAERFRNIFSEGARSEWEFYLLARGSKVEMQWFTFELNKLQPFEYELKMTGQDNGGLWDMDGYLINATGGVTVWWFKHYQNEAVHASGKDFLIFEGQKESSDSQFFEGGWYFRNFEGVENLSGEWKLRRIGVSAGNDIQIEVAVELPGSELEFN